MALITALIGYATGTTARVLAIFDGNAGGSARIAYQDGSGAVQHLDVSTSEAAPYRLATFRLTELSGPKVAYEIGDFVAGGAAPDPAALLAGAKAKAFRLPVDRTI